MRRLDALLDAVLGFVWSPLVSVCLLVTAYTTIAFLNTLCSSARPHEFGPTLTHLLALVLGGWAVGLVWFFRARELRRRVLPPATARQLARAARANRLDVRERPRIPAPRKINTRWVSPANINFEEGDTEP